MVAIYTVGHSNHSIDKFVSLITANGITAIADVRSRPFSRRHPQFNKERLAATLAEHGVTYLFLGKELGARSDDPSHYEGSKLQYPRLAASALFKSGMARVLKAAQLYRVALMCAEREPLDCHRTLLVARGLETSGASILHILPNASIEAQPQTMSRLIDMMRLSEEDLFQDHGALVETACKIREGKIAATR